MRQGLCILIRDTGAGQTPPEKNHPRQKPRDLSTKIDNEMKC